MSTRLLKAALDVIEFKLKSLQERVDTVQTIKGETGDQGPEGKAGKDGKDGKDGLAGPAGLAGKDGSDGVDGADGVGIEDAVIDIDGHLVLTLTNGNEIDAGDLTDTFHNSDKIVQIIRGGGGGGGSGGGSTDLTTVNAKNAEQDTRLDSLETRADANDVTNTQQDNRLTSLETRDQVFIFTTTQNITALVPLTINHNLGLTNRDSFTIRIADNTGEQVFVENTSLDVNSIRLDSFVTLPNAVITIIGF